MDLEQPEHGKIALPTELPVHGRQLSTEASIIPGESEEDGLLRREYVLVGDNKTIEFGRTVDGMFGSHVYKAHRSHLLEIAAERRRQPSGAKEDSPTSEKRMFDSPRPSLEQRQPSSAPPSNTVFPPPRNPLAPPLSISPSRGSALTRALHMASKKLLGTVTPGIGRVQSTYSYFTGYDRTFSGKSHSPMRSPILLREGNTTVRDPLEEDLLTDLEELAQKTDVLTRWADEMYEYVKAVPKSESICSLGEAYH